MEFTKICAPTLKQLFVRQVEDMILSGKLEIGSQLPGERELAEQMQVSRAVVNAGVAEMAGKGFLEIRPRIGIFVADYHRSGTLETLVSIMNYNGGNLRRAEIRSILEIRIALDRLTVQRVCAGAATEDLRALAHYMDEMAVSDSPAKSTAIAFAFHHELSVLSGNTLLPLIYSSFKVPIMSLWERYCRLHGTNTIYYNTNKLYQLIIERNTEQAIQWIEIYIGQSIEGSMEIYSE